jgi:hypothetical protein
VLECPLQDLGVHLDDFDLRRPPGYAYQPLQQALAGKCGVPPDCMVTAMGDLVSTSALRKVQKLLGFLCHCPNSHNPEDQTATARRIDRGARSYAQSTTQCQQPAHQWE